MSAYASIFRNNLRLLLAYHGSPQRSVLYGLQHQQQRGLAVKIGDTASLTKTFSQEDVLKFVDLSLDSNPIHIDENYVKGTRFKKPIVHGALAMGLLSGVLGTKVPGPGSVLLSYELKFPAPFYVGEEVEASVTVTDIVGRKITVDMTCKCEGGTKTVVQGICRLLLLKDVRNH